MFQLPAKHQTRRAVRNRSTFGGRSRRIRRRPAFYRPQLLVLEDRNLPGFLAPVNYAAGDGPVSVAVGDFDGDGTPDLAVANVYSANVSVLLGNADGTFRPAVNYAALVQSFFVAVGDLRGARRRATTIPHLLRRSSAADCARSARARTIPR